MVSVFTPQSRGCHPGQPSGVTPCLAICAVSPPGGAWQRRLNAEGDILWEKLFSFSLARCRLQPVRQAPPRGEGDSYWQPAVAPVMAGQRPAVHRSERRRAHFCSERCIEGFSDGCIVGFARLVYCCYCLTDLFNLFCGTYNIDICMMIWHLLLTVFCPDNVKMMYQQHDVLMETVKMHCQKMYMMWNKVLWKKIVSLRHWPY